MSALKPERIRKIRERMEEVRTDEVGTDLTDELACESDNIRCSELLAILDEIEDWRESARRVMAEECAPDESHCTCVPVLRSAIRPFLALAADVCEVADTMGIPDDSEIPIWPKTGHPSDSMMDGAARLTVGMFRVLLELRAEVARMRGRDV